MSLTPFLAVAPVSRAFGVSPGAFEGVEGTLSRINDDVPLAISTSTDSDTMPPGSFRPENSAGGSISSIRCRCSSDGGGVYLKSDTFGEESKVVQTESVSMGQLHLP
jgi:hypothetical protein